MPLWWGCFCAPGSHERTEQGTPEDGDSPFTSPFHPGFKSLKCLEVHKDGRRQLRHDGFSVQLQEGSGRTTAGRGNVGKPMPYAFDDSLESPCPAFFYSTPFPRGGHVTSGQQGARKIMDNVMQQLHATTALPIMTADILAKVCWLRSIWESPRAGTGRNHRW